MDKECLRVRGSHLRSFQWENATVKLCFEEVPLASVRDQTGIKVGLNPTWNNQHEVWAESRYDLRVSWAKVLSAK